MPIARSEAEALFHLIADNVPQAFFLMSADCREMLYMSPAFERLWQMPRTAVYRDSLCWLERIHPDDLWLFDPSSGDAALARSPDHEYRLVMTDGTLRWVNMQTIPIRDTVGTITRIAGILSDVTERKENEARLSRARDEAEAVTRHRTKELLAANEELLASEARFRTLTEVVPVAIFIQRGDGVTYANPAARRLTGRTTEEMATLDLVSLVSLQGAPAGDRSDPREPAPGVDVDFARPGGEARVLHMNVSRVVFEARDAVLVTAVDVTEHRRAERALREHQASVARATHLSTLEGFASSLAHELNQPLSAIVSYTRALRNRLDQGTVDVDHLSQGLDRVATQALRAGEIMRRLRSLAVRGEILHREVDMNRVAREAVQALRELAAPKSVTVELELAPSLPLVAGDPVHLEIAVSNLLKNALEAVADGPDGDRVVRVSTELTPDARVRVEVRDNGPGVAAHVATALFEPLMSTRSGGMGLGLAITRTLVEAHRGTITHVASGRGAVFRIELPTVGG